MNNLYTLFAIAVNDYTAIGIIQSILTILMAVLGVVLVVIVLMQKSTTDNIGAISGDTDTYYGKNKKQNKERNYKVATIVIGVLMVIVSIVFFVLNITRI